MKGVYVHTLCDHILKDNEGSAEQNWVCHDCNMPYHVAPLGEMMLIVHNTTWKRIAMMNKLDVHNTNNELKPRLNYALAQQISSKCNNSQKKLQIHTQFPKIPMIMALDGAELNGTINIDHTITLPLDGGGNETMVLRGIIYHGGYHFTSRVID
jgi:hypothetical protein